MKCITCSNNHHEKFCPNCGEKSEVKRITLGSMLTDAFSSVTNMDKGFLYNLKTLTLNPQKIAVEYTQGRRKGILNPVSYLIYAVSLYIIIITIFNKSTELSDVSQENKSQIYLIFYESGIFIRTYIKYFWILSIFPLALCLKTVYKKYNYIEHLAISSLIIGHATLVSILGYLIFDSILMFDPFVYFVVFFLVFKVFRDKNTLGDSFFWSILILSMFVIQLIIIAILLTLIKVKF